MLGPSLSLDPRLDGEIRMKRSFRDAYERRAYLRAFLLAKRLLEHPELVERGRTYLERFMKDDPRQRQVYRLWMDTLRLPPEQIAMGLLADNPRGAVLRESAPVFVVIPAEEVRALASAATG